MTGPAGSPALSHLRVLDLTRARAGPTCCRILADFGAEFHRRPAVHELHDYAGAVDRAARLRGNVDLQFREIAGEYRSGDQKRC